MVTERVYNHETEVVWEQDPSNLPYLREFTVRTQKREGLPQRSRNGYIVYGYTNVSDSAPTDSGNCVNKRKFVLKPKDVGGPKNNGQYWQGPNTPAEAVEIDSIEAGIPSTPKDP